MQKHSKAEQRLKRKLRTTSKRQNTSYCAPGVGGREPPNPVGRNVTQLRWEEEGQAGRHSKVQQRLKRELRATSKRQITSYCTPGVGCGGGAAASGYVGGVEGGG